eukprot:TRINITY_DN32912_c0_g1_i1.p2 TRINITY_DN32912_c0_g1~~TRINITY_DN32912_c0_g1_i1.p2  ORF type:complete len:124 (-),score=26.86 TRINITY_DN32912_c0_g1_i1:164-535(-)
MGWTSALAHVYLYTYALLSAVVIGATLRMWTLDWLELHPRGIPLSNTNLGWGVCVCSAVTVLVLMVRGVGSWRFDVAGAAFNSALLAKCTERGIVMAAVAALGVFFVCTWELSAAPRSKPKDA